MAGDWIKMRGNLWDDPRVSNLCDLTGMTEAAIIGGLYWLWSTGDQHSADGLMPGLTLHSIDRKTGIAGFGSALVTVGWLAEYAEGVQIVHFSEHNGVSAKSRLMTAKRVSSHKANAKVTLTPLPKTDSTVTGALPRDRDREEKSSVSKDTDGDAVNVFEMTKAQLWDAGKSLLSTQGMPEKQCGPFVGKLVKNFGEQVVIEAVQATVVAMPVDAAEYLKAACMKTASAGQTNIKPDVTRTTVPGKAGPDPELLKIAQSKRDARPMPEAIRLELERIKALAVAEKVEA